MARHPADHVGDVMVCPVCRERYAGVVDPGCPACRGHGVLLLARRVLREEHSAVIARAVDMYLAEFTAAWIAGRPEGWTAVRIAATALYDAGLLLAPPERTSVPQPDAGQHDRAALGRKARQVARALGANVPLDPDGNTTAKHVDELADRRARRTR